MGKTKFLKRETLILSIFLVSFLFSCQKDDFYENENANQTFNQKELKIKTLTGKEAQKVANRFKESGMLSIQAESGMAFKTTSGGTIKYDEIIEVIDTLGNTNYTFRIEAHPEKNEKNFFNLVINLKDNEQRLLLYKYEMSDDFLQEYNSGNKTIEMFQGRLNIYDLDMGTNPSDITNNNPCEEDIVIDFDPEENPGGNQGATYPVYPDSGNTNPNNPTNTGGSGAPGGFPKTISDSQAHYVCNTPDCGFSSESWSGIQNHYTPDGFTIIFTRFRMINPDLSEENPCGDIGTIGVLPDEDENDCEQLNGLKTKRGFASRMNVLKNNLTGTREKAFAVLDIPNNEFSDVVEGDDDGNVDPFVGLNDVVFQITGAGHNHLQNNPKHIGIFTPEDLRPLLLCGLIETHSENPNSNENPEKSFIFVLTDKGYFLLKINDLDKLNTFIQDYNTWSIDRIKDYLEDDFQNPKKYNILPTSTREQQITGFLRFMQDKDLGIDLYEGDANTYDNIKKLTLVNNGNGNFSFNEEPCEE